MEEVENLPQLLETSEKLRKILQYRKEELLSISFYVFLIELRNLITSNPRLKFSDLVFELLIRIAQGIYSKSLILLSPSTPDDERGEIAEKSLPERQFHFCDCLPLDRILEERVFVSRISVEDLGESVSERGDLTKIISAIISVLERMRAEPRFILELSRESISKIAEELREVISERKSITWRELTEEKGLFSREAMVFAFLALLFLVFEGFCGVHQDAENCIHIYLRT